MFDDEHGEEICRLTFRIGALLEKGLSTRARQQSIEQYFKSSKSFGFFLFVCLYTLKLCYVFLDHVFFCFFFFKKKDCL